MQRYGRVLSAAAEAARRRRAAVGASASARQHRGLRHRRRRCRCDDSVGIRRRRRCRAWSRTLGGGRRDQQRLLELFGAAAADHLQAVLKPWLARRGAEPAELEAALRPLLGDGGDWTDVKARLTALRGTYWAVLDSLNEIPVKAGRVIYNANPPRIVAASGNPISAEVHALGNPEGREVLALEIRRPGTDVSGVGQRALSACVTSTSRARSTRSTCGARSPRNSSSSRGSCAPVCGGPSSRSTFGSSISSRRRC